MDLEFTSHVAKLPRGFPAIPGRVVYSPRIRRSYSDVGNLSRAHGAAFGLDAELEVRALGEAVERFAVKCYRTNDFHLLHTSEIDEAHLDLSEIVTFSEDYYDLNPSGYTNPKEDGPLYWLMCESILAGAPALVPASLIYPPPKGGWGQFDAWTSSGLAAGPDRDFAFVNGLCELIERDSIMCWWHADRCASKIPLDILVESQSGSIFLELVKSGFHVRPFIIKNCSGVDTAVVSLINEELDVFSFGSSCKLDACSAFFSAAIEAIMIGRSQAIQKSRGYHWEGGLKLFDHIMVPLASQYRDKVLERLGRMPPSAFSSVADALPSKQIGHVLRNLNASGLNIYYTDVTPKFLNDSGFCVGRVVVPGLHPLETGPGTEFRDMRRVADFAGCTAAEVQPSAVPHPFG